MSLGRISGELRLALFSHAIHTHNKQERKFPLKSKTNSLALKDWLGFQAFLSVASSSTFNHLKLSMWANTYNSYHSPIREVFFDWLVSKAATVVIYLILPSSH